MFCCPEPIHCVLGGVGLREERGGRGEGYAERGIFYSPLSPREISKHKGGGGFFHGTNNSILLTLWSNDIG